MKKSIALLLTVLMLLSALTACGEKAPASEPIDMELTDLIEKIYETKAPEFGVVTMPIDLTDLEWAQTFTGLDSADQITEAVASESAIGSQAYSLVLVRLKDMADAAEVAKAMEEGINPRKWICVEADDLRVVACGDVVMLIMVDSAFADSITADAIVEAFQTACGQELTVE